MSATVFLIRTIGGFKPADRASEELLNAYPINSEVKAEITVPRNLAWHRMLYALMEVIFPHQRIYPTLDAFTDAVKCAVGHGDTYKLPGGRTMMRARSWSFAKLNQEGFEQLYDRIIELIQTRILPGIDRDDVDREVAEIMAGRSLYQRLPRAPVVARITNQSSGRDGGGVNNPPPGRAERVEAA